VKQLNKVVLIGRLTTEPELRYTSNDTAVSTFTMAVDKFVNGEKQADFIRCKVWGKQAENLAEYQTKGSKIAIDGRIETGSYENKDGNKVYTTEVVANSVEYVESKKGEDTDQKSNNNENKNNRNNGNKNSQNRNNHNNNK
jgi:single-strand DNA-binding protein